MPATPTASVVIGTLADLRQAGFGGQQLGLARGTGELIVQGAALARADVAGQGLARVLDGLLFVRRMLRPQLLVAEFSARR
jgi:hypothetical protein